jgi:putative DNA primase/helicase
MKSPSVAAFISVAPEAHIPPVQPIDAWDFINMQIPQRRFVMEPWLREKGLAMIHAMAGHGKTWFGLSCAYAIATGSSFLHWNAPAPLRVCYLDGEMAAHDVQERLRTLCIKRPDPGFFNLVSFDLYDGPVPNIASEEGQNRLASVIDPAEVVFVDNLSCLAFDNGRTDAEAWEPIQAWMLSLRRRGKSVVLFHHSGKNGSQRGTSRRADALDAIIHLDRPADATGAGGCRFTVTFEKARGQIGKAGDPFEAMLQDGVWSMKTEDQGMLLAVADLLMEGKSIRKVATELGLDPTKVYRLKKLATERKIL